MDVQKILQDHFDGLFADAPKSRAAYELQEELLANSLERYNDLVQDCMNEKAALDSVMDNIGDVNELIAALPKDTGIIVDPAAQKRSALLTTIAVGLYILAGVVVFVGLFIGSMFWNEAFLLFLVAAGFICIVPTCMLVYNAQLRPKYTKQEDTVVEEFKEWSNDTKRDKSVRGAISAVIWTICLVLYFVLSFVTGAWYITWIIFLVAACAEAVVTLITSMRKMK